VRAPGLPAENIVRRGWFLVEINAAPSMQGQSLSSIAPQNQLLWRPFSRLSPQWGKKFTSGVKFMPQRKFTHTTGDTLGATGAYAGQGLRPGGRLAPRTERRPSLPPQPPPTHHRPLPGRGSHRQDLRQPPRCTQPPTLLPGATPPTPVARRAPPPNTAPRRHPLIGASRLLPNAF